MIVLDTEAETEEYTDQIASRLDEEYVKLISVAHQARARELDDQFGYTESGQWTGIRRSGCGATLVGSTDQILSKIENDQKMASALSSSRAIRILLRHGISDHESCLI